MKILFKSTKNLENYYVHAYETWKNALASAEGIEVRNYGAGYPGFGGWDLTDNELYSLIDFTPDMEIWTGGPGNKKPQYINDQFITKGSNKNIPKLLLLTDFWDIIRALGIAGWKEREYDLEQIGVVGYISFYSQAKTWMEEVVKTRFKKFVLFPYAVDDAFFEKKPLPKKWDLNLQLCVNADYPFRTTFNNVLHQEKKHSIFRVDSNHKYKDIEGNKDPLNLLFKRGNPVDNFSCLLDSCWLTLADGYTKYAPQHKEWMLDEDLFLARMPQTLASSGVLVSPEITSDHIAPLEDGIHYISITPQNFQEKINYYLSEKDKLSEISYNATEWAEENVSMAVVGNRLEKDLRRIMEEK